jgi:hypothetical protein
MIKVGQNLGDIMKLGGRSWGSGRPGQVVVPITLGTDILNLATEVGTRTVEKASEGNCNNVWDLIRLHAVHGNLSEEGGSLEDKLGDIFIREISNAKAFQLGSEGPNLGMGWPVEGQQDLTKQVGSGPILDGNSSFQISSEGNSAGVEEGIPRPRHVGFVKGTWGMATTNGWVLVDSLGQHPHTKCPP